MGTISRNKFYGRAEFNSSLKKILLKTEKEKIHELNLSDTDLDKFVNNQATIILKNLYKLDQIEND